MAPAVVGGGARRSTAWNGRDVHVEEIEAQLRLLHLRLHRHSQGEPEHAHSRNCVMNLVVYIREDPATLRFASGLIELLAASHPMRAIVLHALPGRTGRIDAELSSEAHSLVSGMPVQREQIVLTVPGAAGTQLASLLEPLLVPDQPTYLWWTEKRSVNQRSFRQILRVCDVLVVDSGRFERPYTSFLDLSRLADRTADRLGFADLHWARLRPWREALAQYFAPESRRSQLDGIRALALDYAGEGRGNRVGAALLAGWLQSALGWRLSKAAGGGAEVTALFTGTSGGSVEVAFRSREQEELVPGELVAMRLEGREGGRTFSILMERDRDDAQIAHMHVDTGGAASLYQRLRLRHADEGELMFRLFAESRRSTVYQRSLGAGARLLEAVP